ncbi:MAG: DUF2520 domain-containing protein [Selenomonadales bacterium]|nr:DUF2520 domain-containing protein [Selenomonadales bacterium]
MCSIRIAIIGAGKVGTVLARLLTEKGYSVTEVMSRSSDSATRLATLIGARMVTDARNLTADVILVTVSDRAIGDIASSLAVPLFKGRIVLHTSGSMGREVLFPAAEAGLHTGSIHPLFSFARYDLSADDLCGTYYAVDGDEIALPVAMELAHALGGQPFHLSADKRALYHAGAVVASNYLVTLLTVAARQLSLCGLTEDDALRALMPLAVGTLNNLSAVGKNALTGPIVRGDIPTIDKHLHTLGENCPDTLALYRLLGTTTADMATANGQLLPETKTIIHQLLRRDIH